MWGGQKPCRQFKETGACRFGSGCRYSHFVTRDSAPNPRARYETRKREVPRARNELLATWKGLLARHKSPQQRQRTSTAESFFQTALELLEAASEDSMNDAWKIMLTDLASEEGLTFVRDLADRCAVTQDYQTVWKNQLQPFLQVVTHDRVVNSAVLEQEAFTIVNFLVGVMGSRLQKIVDFVLTRVLDDNSKKLQVLALNCAVLFRAVDSNTSNIISPAFKKMHQDLSARLSQQPASTASDFDRRQAEQHLGYVGLVLSGGDALDETSRTSQPLRATEKAGFVLARDLPGKLSASGPRHDNDFEKIEDISILPTDEEILADRLDYLPTNDVTSFHFPGIKGRLDREFRLLREDTIGQLRDAVREHFQREESRDASPALRGRWSGADSQRPNHNNASQLLRTNCYPHFVIDEIDVTRSDGIELLCSFAQPAMDKDIKKRRLWWGQTRRLQPGALVCIVSIIKNVPVVDDVAVNDEAENDEAVNDKTVDKEVATTVERHVSFFTVSPSTGRVRGDEGCRRHEVQRQMAYKMEQKKQHAAQILNLRRPAPAPPVFPNLQPEAPRTLADEPERSHVRLLPAGRESKTFHKVLDLYCKQSGGAYADRPRAWLVEFPGVLLPSFFHTLQSLQQLSKELKLPFKDLLAPRERDGATANVKAPLYAHKENFRFKLDPILTGGGSLRYSPLRHNLDPVALSKASCLDETQSRALLDSLSRELSIIQGPPGTGKSYVGEKLIKVLLANKKKANLGPILTVTMTNHALDQLLEALLADGVGQIIRIGSRSKSEKLEELNLARVAKRLERSRHDNYLLYSSETAADDVLLGMQTALVNLKYSGSTKVLKDYIRQKYSKECVEIFGKQASKEGWQEVKMKHRNSLSRWLNSGDHAKRRHAEWLREIREPIVNTINLAIEEFEKAQNKRRTVYDDINLRCLQQANVVGVTTSGLARNLPLLSNLNCKVLICEEAGEVLEAHLLTSLLPSIQHAIFIGDSQQLRPQTQNYKLNSSNPHGEKYSLDVSLFERLIDPPYTQDRRLPYSVLLTQRRMHCSISNLVRQTLYPKLEDGENVRQYPEVRGLRKRLFWFDHDKREAHSNPNSPVHTASHTNEFETEMAAMLVSHLIKQGSYDAGDIAVITPYLGQLFKLRRRMGELFEIVLNDRDQADAEKAIADAEPEAAEALKASLTTSGVVKAAMLNRVRVATVDNFQGEEAKVVIISLVRSNDEHRVGFLKASNRINVLLSRAKHGMVILGNAETCSRIGMWADAVKMLKENGNFGDELELCCPRHPDTIIKASAPEHFLRFSPEGGCTLKCTQQLDCGHSCTASCHAEILHEAVRCAKRCVKPLKGCDHSCPLACATPCQPCSVILKDITIELPCGHKRRNPLCSEAQDVSAIRCLELVTKKVPRCGHVIKSIYCSVDVNDPLFRCSAVCGSRLECGSHNCKENCFSCRAKRSVDGGVDGELQSHGICKQPCGRAQKGCRHFCTARCHKGSECPLCVEPCDRGCDHSRCLKPCTRHFCAPCAEPCTKTDAEFRCPHNEPCSQICAVPCDHVPCSQRCRKLLTCGHQCPSLCSEICPDRKYCQICSSEEIRLREADLILCTRYDEINLDEDPCLFPPCGHFLTRSSFDGVMDLKSHYNLTVDGIPTSISKTPPPFTDDSKIIALCPTCRGSLRSLLRYGRIVRRAFLYDATKKFISHAHNQCTALTQRLLTLQGGLETDPPDCDTIRPGNADPPATRSSRSGLSAVALDFQAAPLPVRVDSGSPEHRRRWTLLRGVVQLSAKERWNALYRLRSEMLKFRNQISSDQTPFERVAALVLHANRNRPRPLQMHEVYDEQPISLWPQLRITCLALKCEAAILLDFARAFAEAPVRPEIVMDVTEHLKDCEKLVQEARLKTYPREQLEANVLAAKFCIIAINILTPPQLLLGLTSRAPALSDPTPSGSKAKKIDPEAKAQDLHRKGLAYVKAAKVIKAAYASCAVLEPEITAVEDLLEKGLRTSTITAKELIEVYKAMAQEFSGSGHFYLCANGHPFTIADCGMPMELRRCPECDSPIGGRDHALASGVRHWVELEQAVSDERDSRL